MLHTHKVLTLKICPSHWEDVFPRLIDWLIDWLIIISLSLSSLSLSSFSCSFLVLFYTLSFIRICFPFFLINTYYAEVFACSPSSLLLWLFIMKKKKNILLHVTWWGLFESFYMLGILFCLFLYFHNNFLEVSLKAVLDNLANWMA